MIIGMILIILMNQKWDLNMMMKHWKIYRIRMIIYRNIHLINDQDNGDRDVSDEEEYIDLKLSFSF